MKVAVLGSRGFVGSKIAMEAKRRGWSVLQINSDTANRARLIQGADAVVHSVGTLLPDPRYKRLISEPISVGSLASLAALRLGLSTPNPMQQIQGLDSLNFETAVDAAKAIAKPQSPASRVPFIYISAAEWMLAEPAYIASKRRAERYLREQRNLRAVFLRPGFIAPDPVPCPKTTPRHLVGAALQVLNSPARIPVSVVATAACDAVEDSSIEDVVDLDVLNELNGPAYL